MRTAAQRPARGHTMGGAVEHRFEPGSSVSRAHLVLLAFLRASARSKFLSCDLRPSRGSNQTGGSSPRRAWSPLGSLSLLSPLSSGLSQPQVLSGRSHCSTSREELLRKQQQLIIQGLGSQGSRPAPEAFVAVTKGDLEIRFCVGPVGQ